MLRYAIALITTGLILLIGLIFYYGDAPQPAVNPAIEVQVAADTSVVGLYQAAKDAFGKIGSMKISVEDKQYYTRVTGYTDNLAGYRSYFMEVWGNQKNSVVEVREAGFFARQSVPSLKPVPHDEVREVLKAWVRQVK